MDLAHGGHLTHGAPGNFSGRWFDFTGYGTDPETGLIDYPRLRALARARRPKAIVCGSISAPRHPDYALFREIADEVGAYLVVDAAHPMGLIAGGAAPNPVPYADVVCATTHKVLRGPRGGMILCGAELAGRIDRAVFPFTQGGAQMHTVAAKAVAFGEAATPAYTYYAHQVVAHARVLAAGLEAEGFEVFTGGTDTHLVVADPAPLGVDGRTARERLAAAWSWTPAPCRTGRGGASGWARRPSPPRGWTTGTWPGSRPWPGRPYGGRATRGRSRRRSGNWPPAILPTRRSGPGAPRSGGLRRLRGAPGLCNHHP